MASNRSDPEITYPRLHVEMWRLSDASILVDGWLIQNAKGMGSTVLRFCGSMDEAHERISKCVSMYGAQCGDKDIVVHR
jgi:hypothetical protein